MENPIVYGPCSSILRFKADQEEKYRNHLKFIEALADSLLGGFESIVGQVRLYSLKANTTEEFPFMIVITGDRNAYLNLMSPQNPISRQKEQQIIMDMFGGNFGAITPHSSVTDTPSPGQYISSLEPFEKTKQNIASEKYSVTIIKTQKWNTH